MPGFGKVNGTFQELVGVNAKVNGSWKEIIEAYAKVNGAWQQWYASLVPGVAGYLSKGNGNQEMFRLLYATETWAATTNIPYATSNGLPYGDRGVQGYIHTAGNDSTVSRISFVTQVTSTMAGLDNQYPGAGAEMPGVKALYGKGDTTTQIRKTTFPTSVSTIASAFTQSANLFAAVHNGSATAYFKMANNTNNTQKVPFATETASTAATSNYSTNYAPAVESEGDKAFFAIGNFDDKLERFSFATESFAINALLPGNIVESGGGMTNNGVAGYLTQNGNSTGVLKINYATNTTGFAPNPGVSLRQAPSMEDG